MGTFLEWKSKMSSCNLVYHNPSWHIYGMIRINMTLHSNLFKLIYFCVDFFRGLCDIGQTGKLNSEQFALAMWLVQLKIQGKDLPSSLTPEMIPPSLRAKEGSVEELTHSAELDQITKEIENLIREKRQLETDVAQKEADIRIRNGEVRNLQTELDTLTATFKQLEVQKREAQKRLDDLDAQVNYFYFTALHSLPFSLVSLHFFSFRLFLFVVFCFVACVLFIFGSAPH